MATMTETDQPVSMEEGDREGGREGGRGEGGGREGEREREREGERERERERESERNVQSQLAMSEPHLPTCPVHTHLARERR